MPKQVLAEDIERLLATLDGVASARLLTGQAGDIEQLYVTADEGADARTARRAVVAALMSQYGIPIEPWRIHVAQLKRFAPSELPHLTVLHIEETLSGDESSARVHVRWDRAGDQRAGTGQAHGPAGAAHRQRMLAAAVIEAARAVLDPPHRRIALQQVGSTTSMDRALVLVGISATGPRGQEAFVGTAFQREGGPDAAVAAALDAVTKWLLRAATEDDEPVGGSRRAQLEAMRHLVKSGGPGSRGRGDAADGVAAVAHPNGPEAPAREAVGAARPAEPGRPSPGLGRHDAPPPPEKPAPSDVLEDLTQIRPEQKGGAAMAPHQEGRASVTSPRPGRQMFEEEFFQPLIADRVLVHVRCRDGYEIARAVIREVGTYTVLLEADGSAELVYKHAIISIRPSEARG